MLALLIFFLVDFQLSQQCCRLSAITSWRGKAKAMEPTAHCYALIAGIVHICRIIILLVRPSHLILCCPKSATSSIIYLTLIQLVLEYIQQRAALWYDGCARLEACERVSYSSVNPRPTGVDL